MERYVTELARFDCDFNPLEDLIFEDIDDLIAEFGSLDEDMDSDMDSDMLGSDDMSDIPDLEDMDCG